MFSLLGELEFLRLQELDREHEFHSFSSFSNFLKNAGMLVISCCISVSTGILFCHGGRVRFDHECAFGHSVGVLGELVEVGNSRGYKDRAVFTW